MVVDSAQAALSDAQVDLIFHALADATRRDIIRRTIEGEHSVSALARRYPMSVTAVQKHVATLERAELVSRTKQGREQIVTSRADTIARARMLLDDIESLWRGRLERIDDLLACDTNNTDTDTDITIETARQKERNT